MKDNLQLKTRKYEISADFLHRFARHFKKVSVSEEEIKTLKLLFRVMRYVDHENDKIADDATRLQFQRKILESMHSSEEVIELPLYARKDFNELREIVRNEKVAEEFADKVEKIFSYSERIRKMTSTLGLFSLTAKEGELTSQLVLLFLKRYSKSYASFVLYLGTVGNVVDTFLDFRKDWKEGCIVVRPTFFAYWSYLHYTLEEVFAFAKYVLRRPKLIAELFRMVLKTRAIRLNRF